MGNALRRLMPILLSCGLHLADANIALGDLARLVRRRAAACARSR